MYQVSNETQMVVVSHYDESGLFISTENIMIFAGCGLPRNSTDVIYTPIKDHNGFWDSKRGIWVDTVEAIGYTFLPNQQFNYKAPKGISAESVQNSHKLLRHIESNGMTANIIIGGLVYDSQGNTYIVETAEVSSDLSPFPLPEIPEGKYAVIEDHIWRFVDSQIGKVFYTDHGEDVVTHDPFALNEHQSFTVCPELKPFEIAYIEDSKWVVVLDYNGAIITSKESNSHVRPVKDHTDVIPEGWVLGRAPSDTCIWQDEAWVECPQLQLIKLKKTCRAWRDAELEAPIKTINIYTSNLNIPANFRSNNAPTETHYQVALLQYKVLCEYPNNPNFPYNAKPDLDALEVQVRQSLGDL